MIATTKTAAQHRQPIYQQPQYAPPTPAKKKSNAPLIVGGSNRKGRHSYLNTFLLPAVKGSFIANTASNNYFKLLTNPTICCIIYLLLAVNGEFMPHTASNNKSETDEVAIWKSSEENKNVVFLQDVSSQANPSLSLCMDEEGLEKPSLLLSILITNVHLQ